MIKSNFGSNNYSCGMEAVTVEPTYSNEEILAAGLFLHPTVKPNQFEIFALRGTQQQYDKFMVEAKKSWAAKKAIDELSVPDYRDRESWDTLTARIEELEAQFKPWFAE